jgi:hypothetical protein
MLAVVRQMEIKSMYFTHKRIHLKNWPLQTAAPATRNTLLRQRKCEHRYRDKTHAYGHKIVIQISRASNTAPQQQRRFEVDRFNNGHVATVYHLELEAGDHYTWTTNGNEWRKQTGK